MQLGDLKALLMFSVLGFVQSIPWKVLKLKMRNGGGGGIENFEGTAMRRGELFQSSCARPDNCHGRGGVKQN